MGSIAEVVVVVATAKFENFRYRILTDKIWPLPRKNKQKFQIDATSISYQTKAFLLHFSNLKNQFT